MKNNATSLKNVGKGKVKSRTISVNTKILSFVIALVAVSNLILGVGTYLYAKNLIFSQVQSKAQTIAYSGAAVTDGDALVSIDTYDVTNETVVATSEVYKSMTSEDGAAYIYAFLLNDKKEPFFAATSDYEESADSIGETFEMYEGMEKAFQGEMAADDEPTTDEWGTFLSGYAPILDSKGSVVGIVGADINYSYLAQRINNLRTQIILMFVMIFVILMIGCFIIDRLLKRGFYALNSKVEELADGSGDLNREVEIHSGDEFETIAISINNFIKEVRSLVQNVAIEADASAEAISDINNRVTELSANMEECSATSESISARLEGAANNIESIASTVKTIDDKVAKASEKAAKESEFAMAHKEEATDNIKVIQDNVRLAAERAKAVDQVQKIAAEIKGIASETRILALNAQIEAARAGDAGKGFVVVAEEMESLNEQISEAAAAITDINDTVLKSVNDLVKGIVEIDEYLTKKVLPDYDEYAKLGEEYGDMAELVSRDMAVLTAQTDSITTEVQAINVNVHDISKAVADGANQVTKVNDSSMMIVDNMNRLTDNPMLKMVQK